MRRPLTRRPLRFALGLALALLLAGVVASVAAAVRFSDAPCTESGSMRVCPAGSVGGAYNVTLKGDGGCGPALPYQYKILNGALPAGLSLSSSGVISGTPTAAGTSNFWVELSDQDPPSQSWCVPKKAEREFQITIQPGFRIDNTVTSKFGTVGQAYSDQLKAFVLTTSPPPQNAPTANATWTLVSGALPPGLTLAANGLVSGTPTAEGVFTFKVKAEASGSAPDDETFTIDVKRAVAIAATPATLPPSEVGIRFQLALAASGGTGTFTWTLDGTLPDGVTFDALTGTFNGTPTEAGAFSFTATATDQQARTATYQGRLVVAQKLALVKPTVIKPAKVGKLWKLKLRTTGGVLPNAWKLKKGPLPKGVKFDKKLGLLAGTPAKAGRYRVTVEVTDALKVKSTATFVIVVAPAPSK